MTNVTSRCAGDPKYTSEKVRCAARTALQSSKRPMAVHEFEAWITRNDSILAREIASKCYDYVRMILSISEDTVIVKYHAAHTVPGIDPRALFYGLPEVDYGDGWVVMDTGKKKPRKKAARHDKVARRRKSKRAHKVKSSCNILPGWCPTDKSDDIEVHPAMTSDSAINQTPTVPIDLDEWYLDNQTAMASWAFIGDTCGLDSPIWIELLSALDDAKQAVQENTHLSTKDIISTIMSKYELLTNPEIAEPVTNILRREVTVALEEIAGKTETPTPIQIFTAARIS